MKFTYTKFGILKEVQVAPPYWHIVNEEGSKVSINYQQYARGQGFLDKLNELVGHPVVYRTTRRDESKGETGEWPSDHWFSDVFLDDGLSHNWPKEGDKETVQTIVELRLDMKRVAKRAERELKEAEQQRDYDRQQTEGMLKFEAEVEAMPYSDFSTLLNTDEFFRQNYAEYVKWKSERFRTDAEREQNADQKAAWDKIKPVGQLGFEWRHIGRIGSWEVSSDGNLKVWGQQYGEWYHFAFPQHVFYRTLQQSKLPTLQKHSVWALVNDNDHTKDITYVDMTVRLWVDDPEDNQWEPYSSINQTELLPHLIEKINDNANAMEAQAEGYGDAMMELELLKYSDEELIYFYQTELRQHERRAMGLEAAIADQLTNNPEFAKKFRQYSERRKELEEKGDNIFTAVTHIENFESYKWIELPAMFNVTERPHNPHAPNVFLNSPKVPLQVYYEKGDVRRWTFDGGPRIEGPKESLRFTMHHDFRGSAMRRKLTQQLDKFPIYLLVNEEKMTFLDVTLANGDLDEGRLELMQCYEDQEHHTRLSRKIERYAIDRSSQADSFEQAFLQARGELSQLTEERRAQVETWTDQVTENWEMLENEPRFRLLIIGMAVFANDRNGKSAVTHVDATLAVRCGINTSTKSKLVVDIYDRNYRRGEVNQNMVEAIINPDEEGNGQSVTIGIGKSSHKNYWDKWIITTAFSADSKLESALKKLGYRDFDRDNKTKPIGYFLRLHKDAIAMVRDRNHPYWKNPPARR